MRALLRVFRNFFILFAIFVGLSILLANSQKARDFITPGTGGMEPDFDLPTLND